jgi:hypothetical protein
VAGVVVPEVVVVAGAVLAVVGDVVVDLVVDVDAMVDEARRAFAAPEDPHAPTVTSITVTNAPAHR